VALTAAGVSAPTSITSAPATVTTGPGPTSNNPISGAFVTASAVTPG